MNHICYFDKFDYYYDDHLYLLVYYLLILSLD